MERETVLERHDQTWYAADEHLAINDLIEDLERLKREGVLVIELRQHYDDEIRLVSYKERQETDEEYERRIEHERRFKEAREKSERKLYERLKAKYEV